MPSTLVPPQEEEPQCAYPALTAACEPKCTGPMAAYEACKERIAKKPELGDCEPWYFDYLKCIDKCRVPKIMKHLK